MEGWMGWMVGSLGVGNGRVGGLEGWNVGRLDGWSVWGSEVWRLDGGRLDGLDAGRLDGLDGGRTDLHPIVGEMFTQSAAKAFMPRAVGFSLALHKARAWMAKVPSRTSPGPLPHSVTWRGCISHRAALLEVLRWAWDRFAEHGGSPPTFDLSM